MSAESIRTAWQQHGDDPEGVASRFEALVQACPDDDAPALVGLIVHVHGEHLRTWRAGEALVARLPASDARRRGLATLQLCRGEPLSLEGADRARVLAVAASAVAAHGRIGDAARWLDEASALVAGIDDGHAAVRAVAITANNLSVELVRHDGRSADETALMLRAAHLAQVTWARAGTWVNDERAAYQLAKAYASAGQGEQAVAHAQRCLAVCEAHDADAGERLFGHEALATAYLAGGRHEEAAAAARDARALLDRVDEGLRSYATDTVDRLDERLKE